MTEDFFMRLCDVYGFAPSRALRELVDAAIGQAVVAERYEAARSAKLVQEPCPNCASLQDQNIELDRKLAELHDAVLKANGVQS